MNTTTITIDNRDLAFTIDTYGMFTGGIDIENLEIDDLKTIYNLTDDEAEALEFDYDHAGVVKALAEQSVQLLHQHFVQHGDGTILDIDLGDTQSPKFYNYTTDSYTADWTVDMDKLRDYIESNWEAFRTFANDWGDLSVYVNWNDRTHAGGGAMYDGPPIDIFKHDDCIAAMIDYYTRNDYDPDDYNMSMFEYEFEAWSANMTLAPESQQLIARKAEVK